VFALRLNDCIASCAGTDNHRIRTKDPLVDRGRLSLLLLDYNRPIVLGSDNYTLVRGCALVTPTSLSLAAVLHAWFSQVVLLTFSGGGHPDMSSVHSAGVWKRVRKRDALLLILLL
jgi:hypothetical protein